MSSQGRVCGDGHGRRSQSSFLKGSVGAKISGAAVAALLACLTMAAGASAQSVCSDTWAGPSEGNWQTAADWSTGNVPTSSDVACIEAPDRVIVSEGAAQAGVVQGEGALAVSAGTLELTNALEASSIASLTLGGGTLTIAGELSVSSVLSAGGSGVTSVSGSGRLVVGSAAQATITGGRCYRLFLNGVTLVNQGTLTFGAPSGAEDGSIWMENGAQLQNTGTFNDNSTEPGGCGFGRVPSINNNGGTTPTITNTGTFQSTDSQEPITINVPFDNQGNATAQVGRLQLGDGGTNTTGATFAAATGATLEFTGGSFALTGANWSGPGTIGVSGATVTAASLQAATAHVSVSGGSLSIPSGSTTSVTALTLTGGTLDLPGQLNVNNMLSGAGRTATIEGSGKLVVGSAAQGTITGERCYRLFLNGITLVNQGTLTFGAPSGAEDGSIWMENGAQLQNTGTFNDNSTEPGGCGFGRVPSINNNGGTTPTITNTGTFQSTDSQEPITINVPLTNQGNINAQTGTLQLNDGGSATSTADFSAATGATLAFTSGSYTLTGANWTGAGTIAVQGANVSAAEVQSTSAVVNVSGGSLSIPAGSTSAINSGSLAIGGQSTTIEGSGRLVVGPSATGTISASRCSRAFLNGVTLVNQGTITSGTPSGAEDGSIWMENGAQLQNTGTFNDNSTEPGGCGFGRVPSINNNGGTTPTITNTGTFQSTDSQEPITINVPFDNQGNLISQAGTLQLSGGGTSTGSTFTAPSGTTLEFAGGSFSLTGDTWSGGGTIAVSNASVAATNLQASTTHVSVSRGSLSIPEGSASRFTALVLTEASLALAGELSVSSVLSAGGSGVTSVSGSGRLVVGSAAQATITGGRCYRLFLNGVTLVNQGTLTFGAPSGAEDGSIWMENGAQLQNTGTFNDNSTEPGGCGFGRVPSINNNGGTTPTITNTGTFQSTDSQEPITINVPFDNQGNATAQVGRLQLGDGGTNTTGATFAAATGATLEFTGGSFALTGANWSGPGTIGVSGATVTAASLQAATAHVSVSGGSLSIPSGSTTSVTALTLTGGTLDLPGQLNVNNMLSGAGRTATIEGSGKLVVGSAAQGTITGERCYRLFLNGITLVNQGTLTFGAPSGAEDGSIWMENGAQLQNTGTFNDNSTEPGGCGFGRVPSINNNGGTTPTITNTGTFQSTDSQEPITINVPLTNQGNINAQTGTLQLNDGGSATSTADFSAATGATLAFTSGSYTLTGANWTGAGTIAVQGANVSASGLHASGNTGLNSGVLTIPQGAELQMSGALAVGGNFTIVGPGTLAAEPGSTATTAGGCARLLLENVTYLNKGTFTLARDSAALWMQNGAQLDNDGALIDQSVDPSCGFGSGGDSIYNGGGSESTILDAGTFRAEDAGNTLVVAVPFNDQGTIEAKSGTLQLDGNITNSKLVSIDAGARLNVTGDYVQGENGTLKIGVTSPSSFGSLSVNGTSGLDGLLKVAAAGGYTSELGQTFAVLATAAESGAFSFVGGSGLPSGASYQPDYSNTGVTLLVANAEGQVPVPVLTTPPHISAGSPQQGQTLVLTHGAWEHVPSEYVDQWLRCSESGGECLPIPGAGGQEYVTTRSDVGHTIVVQEIARNAGGESKPADSTATALVSALPLHAAAGENVSTFTDAKVALDGSASTPASEITSYRWEFGDGESAEGADVRHVYKSPGTYTATLTVNRGGEHDSQSLTVTVVTPPGAEHAAAIALTDSGEHPISEADVLYVAANGTRTEETTNSRGEADLAGLPEGEDTVYVYKSGFRPATGTVDVNSEHQGFASITLEPGEVASTGLSSHELTFSEIVEAGIDPSEPANQTVDSFEATLEFAGSITVELQGHINSEGEFAGNAPTGNVTPPEGGSPSPLKCEQQGANPEHTGCETTVENSSGETTRIIAKPTTIETHPVIQWLILRGSAVTVKQFFEMSMVVQNLSPEEPFGLTAGTATLNLPSGMSLAPTAEPQSLSQSVAAIPPLGGATTTWIIRGDAPGEYTPSVDYEAELEPFGTAVSTQAALAQPLEVWGANALGTVLKVDSGLAEPGIPYHVALGVKNVSNIPLYNVAVNTSAPVHNHFILQPDQQFSVTVGELRPGQTVFAPQYILVTQSPHEIYGEIKEGKLIGESDAELKSVTLAGETSNATPTIEQVSPPPLYETRPSAAGGEIHLQWQQVPGAEGYEVFSTASLGTPFGASPLAVLPATASSANVSGSSSEFFAVSTLIGGHPILDHPLVDASRAGQEEEEKEREKQEEEELERERHKREEEAKKEKHEGEENESEPNHRHCKSGDAVNCATGNHTETQTDLEVGGRGPALSLTRTYNSQQAARQSTPGTFGYGWTGPRSAYATVSRWCSVKRTCGSRFSGSVVVHQANGATVYFSKPEEGGPGKEGWSAGPLVQSSLTEAGNQLIMRLPDGHTLTFNTSGHLSTHLGPAKFFSITEGRVPISSEADRNGNALSFSYNEAGQLTAIADASGRRISFSYNSEGLVTSATDPMAHTVKYGYEHGNLISETEPGETTPRWKYAYDSAHQMTSETEGANHTETTEYDAEHRVIAQTDAAGRKRAWKYTTTSSGPQTTITEPNGSTTIEQFNSDDSPTSITRAAGTPLAVTTFSEYNGEGELVATTNGAGGETTYTYDAEGNRTSERDPLGNTTKWTYNAAHEITSETKPNGETTTITRDEHGNETEVSRPAPGGQTQTTKHTYNSAGQETSTTDPLGRKWTYAYDANGDRESETDPEGNKRTFSYDEDSNEISSVSPLGNVAGAEAAKFKATIGRDARERMIETIDPLGHTTKTTYNSNGQLATFTDANGKATTYAYDADNEPTKVTEADGAVKETEYDAAGQVIAHIDGDHHKTTYVRNALEQVTEVIDPLGHRTTKSYDANGNLTHETNPEGKTTTYTYDADNRQRKVAYSDGKTASVEYEYNADGNRTKMVDASGTTTYAYDALDRLTESVDGHGDRTAHEYDLASEPLKVTYPNGKVVTHTFDSDGRLKTTTDWLGNTTTFSYNADSDQTATTFPHASENVDEYVYNDADELTKTVMKKGKKTLASLAYTRAKNGQVTKTTSKELPGEAKTSLTYDAADRLTKDGTVAYEYDAAGNPTKIGTTTDTFNAGDELTSTSAGATYSYNEDSQRIKATPASGPATAYAYDQAGNLIAVNRPGEGATQPIEDTYTYNGDGLRVSQSVSGHTSYLSWEAAELPLLLSDGSNSYIYGPGGRPTEQISNEGKILYLHHDQQGSTRLLTGSTGAVEGTFTYGGYGNLTGSTGTATTPLGYAGQYTEANTGLIYLRARSYEPATAQFTSVDPDVASTGSPYGYAKGDPIDGGDPSGLASAAEIRAETVQEALGQSAEAERQLYAERLEAEKACDQELAAQKAREIQQVKELRYRQVQLLKTLDHMIDAEERRRLIIEWYKDITEYFAKTYACELPLSLVGGPESKFWKLVTGTAAGVAGNVCSQWASPDETDG